MVEGRSSISTRTDDGQATRRRSVARRLVRRRWPRAVARCHCGAEVGLRLPPRARELLAALPETEPVARPDCSRCGAGVVITAADVRRAA